MNFIVESWPLIILAIAAIALAVVYAIRFFGSSKEEQMKKIKEWLLYATTIAEKELGGGTGKLKLRYVYDMFVSKFPWMSVFMSFDRFETLVDDVLIDMNELLTTNNDVNAYVKGAIE